MKILATNIRMLRQQNNWSQEDIARKLGISIPAFSKIEPGSPMLTYRVLNR